ncbi:Tyrosinase co-factor MelC1 [Actinoplanes philippinensis]|uniref:Tyrosinase co-factor MelC1 n=1 Tax=Actinoplanes philippinensis TaxID=35752 RepID=A0A1I2GM37_9ACTN|nr:tyrosinase family oxidase copper chaperone [Actinoplanes philippinensis]SFF19004.1 Tyrosinase co-factor MelC1 [Actinoplanes philippinensis]
MLHGKRRGNGPGYAVRAVALLAVAVAAATTAGTVYAGTGPDVDPAATPSASASTPVAKPAVRKPGFFETYHGHHIMGWGENDTACAYIDGVQLVLYPTGDGGYTSNLQGFQQEPSVRAITKASVKTLGKLRMTTPDDGAAHCPTFAVREPAKSVKPARTTAPTASPAPVK